MCEVDGVSVDGIWDSIDDAILKTCIAMQPSRMAPAPASSPESSSSESSSPDEAPAPSLFPAGAPSALQRTKKGGKEED